jgi:hypothetical protein
MLPKVICDGCPATGTAGIGWYTTLHQGCQTNACNGRYPYNRMCKFQSQAISWCGTDKGILHTVRTIRI